LDWLVSVVQRYKGSVANSGRNLVCHSLKNRVETRNFASCGLSEVPALVDGIRDTASYSLESSRNSGEGALNAACEVLTYKVRNVAEVNTHSGTDTLSRSRDMTLQRLKVWEESLDVTPTAAALAQSVSKITEGPSYLSRDSLNPATRLLNVTCDTPKAAFDVAGKARNLALGHVGSVANLAKEVGEASSAIPVFTQVQKRLSA